MAPPTLNKADVVREIRAVLDSTPNGLDSVQIDKDYRALCGRSLRFRAENLGYRDIDSFLLSLVSEGHVLADRNAGGYIYRAAVSDASTAHLQALVRNQVSGRKNKNRRSSPAFSSTPVRKVPPQAVRKALPKSIQGNVLQLVRERRMDVPLANFLKYYHEKFGVHFNHKTYGFSSLKDAISTIDDIKVTQRGDHAVISCEPIEPLMSTPSHANIKSQLCQDIVKVLKARNGRVLLTEFSKNYEEVHRRSLSYCSFGYNSLLNLLSDMDDPIALERPDELGGWIVTLGSAKKKVSKPSEPEFISVPLQKLKEIIVKLVRSNGSGIYLTAFEQIFKKEISKELNPKQYGFTNVQSLLRELDDNGLEIFNGEYGAMVRLKSQDSIEDKSKSVTIDTEIMRLHDAVGPGVSYNDYPKLPFHQYIEVLVSQVYSPSHFYVQVMADDNTGKRLEELMDLLEFEYDQSERSKQYLLPPSLATPGQIAVCRYPNDQNWHRARITKVLDSTFVQVVFVDYGTCCGIHKANLYYMRQRFLRLPPQAHPATLHGIIPVDGINWSAGATRVFLDLVSGKRLCAKIVQNEGTKQSICLSDTSTSVDLHINDYLVSSQLAKFVGAIEEVEDTSLTQLNKFDWEVSSDEDDGNFDSPLSDDFRRAPTITSIKSDQSMTQSSLSNQHLPVAHSFSAFSSENGVTKRQLEKEEETLLRQQLSSIVVDETASYQRHQASATGRVDNSARSLNERSLTGNQNLPSSTVKINEKGTINLIPSLPSTSVAHSSAVQHRSDGDSVRHSGGMIRHSGGIIRHSGGIVRHSGNAIRHGAGVVRHSGGVIRSDIQLQTPAMQQSVCNPIPVPLNPQFSQPIHRPSHHLYTPQQPLHVAQGHPIQYSQPVNLINSYPRQPVYFIPQTQIVTSYSNYQPYQTQSAFTTNADTAANPSYTTNALHPAQLSSRRQLDSFQSHQNTGVAGASNAKGTTGASWSTLEPSKPPPLIPYSEFEKNKVSALVESQGSTYSKPSVDELRFKLSGLQLKKKRLLRERSEGELSELSDTESNISQEDELLVIAREIDSCKASLNKLSSEANTPVQNKPKSFGRGFGRGRALFD